MEIDFCGCYTLLHPLLPYTHPQRTQCVPVHVWVCMEVYAPSQRERSRKTRTPHLPIYDGYARAVSEYAEALLEEGKKKYISDQHQRLCRWRERGKERERRNCILFLLYRSVCVVVIRRES